MYNEKSEMKQSGYFPLFIDMDHKKVVVIGGGKIASRRIETLLKFGVSITVVAPELTEALKDYNSNHEIEWIAAQYSCAVLLDAYMVLAATNDRLINKAVGQDARAYGILVNVCDNKDECDFYFPAIVKDGSVVIGITASGENHGLVKSVAQRIRDLFAKFGEIS